ncbi:hypothetical protein GMDG_07341 [Pseudogymnoascus destructans 20631-21]|uniref:Uncharacterized protein n=1 Tax=Pseudogymnoascus destructans (strain ATCC MYA-4855 / 20631-21) TaxID=658429 RepID=L8FXY5_PSED2|nr:hypothetical protein GMDG_07341 [Pseudogymnoascus destructans 20631-21]
MRFCHSLLSRSLRVESPSRSTTGNIPLPTGKYCPTRLALWTDCSARQQKIYSSVCNYLQPSQEARARLFTPLIALEEDARRFGLRPISSEQGLENYERTAVEDHVRDIIAELCKIDAARDEFGLEMESGSTITPTLSIHAAVARQMQTNHQAYIAPDPISSASTESTATLTPSSLRSNTSLPTSFLWKHFAWGLGKWTYGNACLQEPNTSIARVLCLCLMAFHSPVRDQEWRNTTQSRLYLWTTSFDHARSQIPKEVLEQITLHSDSTNSEYNLQQQVAECPRGLKPAVPHQMSDTGFSRQNRQAPTRIKRPHANEASARSHLPLPRNERLVNARLGKIKAAIRNAMMHSFAPRDVY